MSVTATDSDNALLAAHNVTLWDMSDLLQCLTWTSGQSGTSATTSEVRVFVRLLYDVSATEVTKNGTTANSSTKFGPRSIFNVTSSP